MRKIEQEVLAAWKSGKLFTRYARAMDDNHYGLRHCVSSFGADLGIEYKLWSTTIAKRTFDILTLGVEDGSSDTVTTRRWINVFADYYGLSRVYRVKGETVWSDGKDYTGARAFNLFKDGRGKLTDAPYKV